MSKKEELYAFQVARTRAKENTLLSKASLEAIVSSASYDECLRQLSDKGWDTDAGKDADTIVKNETEKLLGFMHELLGAGDMKLFDIFLVDNDFHNLKAAVKESYVGKEVAGVYKDSGKIPLEKIKKCAETGDFSSLPDNMRRAAVRAKDELFQTGDSQLFDVIIDKAALEEMIRTARESQNSLLKDYAELMCAAADINIALRASKAKKGEDFFRQAFAECETLNIQGLTRASLSGQEAVLEFLSSTPYADGAESAKQGAAAFDIWRDNRVIELIKPQKYNAFTASPIIAYVLARKMEIKSVRIILSGKLNALPEERIRERVRESYV